MIVSGHGGYLSYFPTVTTDPDANPPYGKEVRIDLDAWVGGWSCEYSANTPAGAGNGTLLLPKIGRNAWTASFPLDTTSDGTEILEFVSSFRPGMALYAAYFQRGNETFGGLYRLYDALDRTTITNVQMVDNNTDALRVVLTGMGGRLTQGYKVLITP